MMVISAVVAYHSLSGVLTAKLGALMVGYLL